MAKTRVVIVGGGIAGLLLISDDQSNPLMEASAELGERAAEQIRAAQGGRGR